VKYTLAKLATGIAKNIRNIRLDSQQSAVTKTKYSIDSDAAEVTANTHDYHQHINQSYRDICTPSQHQAKPDSTCSLPHP
jgi:hypothetical protein